MVIHMLIEPDYRHTLWCRQTLDGLLSQAQRRKAGAVELEEEALRSQTAIPNGDILVIIGTSTHWISRVSSLALQKKLLFLLVTGDQDIGAAQRTNTILMDYRSSMQELLFYLQKSGEEKIALFGVNPSSYADTIKKDAFPWKENIYYNDGSILESARCLRGDIGRFGAVICVNDMVAVYLLHFLKGQGLRIPEQVRLVSFGGSLLSRLMQPSLISVEQDFHILGMQAVRLSSFLVKNPGMSINAFVRCPLLTGESAAEEGGPPLESPRGSQPRHVNFYIDESIAPLLSLERLLCETDDLDHKILALLLEKEPQEHIAERLHLALSSLRYRIHKMCSCFPDGSKSRMLETIRKYLPPDALQKADRTE